MFQGKQEEGEGSPGIAADRTKKTVQHLGPAACVLVSFGLTYKVKVKVQKKKWAKTRAGPPPMAEPRIAAVHQFQPDCCC